MVVGLPFSQSTSSFGISSGPANIIITNLSTLSSFGSHAPLLFVVGLRNEGGLASSNITLYAYIRGPANFNDSFGANPLSPLENESVIITRANRTLQSGNYTITVNASYLMNGTLFYTNSESARYNITPTENWPSQNVTLIQQTQNLSITYAPIYTALFLNNQTVSQLGIKNSGALPEFVNMSVGYSFQNLIDFSTNSVYLQPNESLNIQLVIKSNNTALGLEEYDIPINFSITNSNGLESNLTEHIILTISNTTLSQPRVLNQINLLDSSNSIVGIVEIRAASNSSLQNATLSTLLPSSVVTNATKIMTYGLQANVSKVGKRYSIAWQIPYLPAGQVVYGYYTIKNAESQNFPLHLQNILSVPSTLRPSNLLKVLNLSIPTFYTNTTTELSASVLYTGTTEQQVYFYLTAPPGITVYNSTQGFNATPNEVLNKNFFIRTDKNSGTLILTLYIATPGANITYSLPVVVLEAQNVVRGTTIRSTTGVPAINTRKLEGYGGIAVGIVLVILLVYGMVLIINRPRYNRERAKRLLNVRDQIKRQSGGIG